MIQYFSCILQNFQRQDSNHLLWPQIAENIMEQFLNIPYSELSGFGGFCLFVWIQHILFFVRL